MNEIPSTHEIPIPEGLEQRLSALVDRLEAEERGRTSELASASQASRASTRPLTRRASVAAAAFAIAAVFAAVAILVIAPQVKERRELARYEGSYTLRDGQRIDDLGSIKTEISFITKTQSFESSRPKSARRWPWRRWQRPMCRPTI